MTKQKFKQTLSEIDTMFMNIVFKDGSELEVSNEQLVGTDEDIAKGYYYAVDYDADTADDEIKIRISDIAEIIPLEDEDEEEWEDDDEDWDEDEDEWDDDDEEYDDDDVDWEDDDESFD